MTVTSTGPAEPEGLVTVMDESLLTVGVAAFDPKLTAVAWVKPVPVIVTVVPPATGPFDGLTFVTVGMGRNANLSDEDVGLVPISVVTVTSTVAAASGGLIAARNRRRRSRC